MNESNLQFSAEKVDELTKLLFEIADSDHSGSITFEELQELLENHPGVAENLTISAAKWLKPPSFDSVPYRFGKCLPYWMSQNYFLNNLTWILWVVVFVLLNIILFVEASVRHKAGVSFFISKNVEVKFVA